MTTTTLPCPFCGSLESRATHAWMLDDGHTRRRRRVCLVCGLPHFTREQVEREPNQEPDRTGQASHRTKPPDF